MTVKNETLDAVIDELNKHGIATTISHGSKHIQVRWLNRLGEPRFTTVTRREGEWRQARNARHQIRQKLREDGMLSEPDNAPSSGVRPLSKVQYLEQELHQLNVRVARVEQLLKEQTT